MTAVETRVERLQEKFPEVDYVYYKSATGEYYEDAMNKYSIIAVLKEINPDKSVIVQGKLDEQGVIIVQGKLDEQGVMIIDDVEGTIENLIKNLQRNRISKFEEVDKQDRAVYRFFFEDAPDCLAYHIIEVI